MILYDKEKMTDVSAVGGKAAGLVKLISYGYNVPDFFVITAGTVLNGEFAAELKTFAADLHCNVFSVRSSCVNEDGATNSFAGQYLTLLSVKKEDLFAAVKKVAQSVHSQKISNYAEHFDVSTSEMAIIVQKQICGTKSGVLFTQSPASDEEVIIESVDGGGEALVSGAITPHKTVIKRCEMPSADDQSELVRAALMLEKLEGYPLDIEWTVADKLYFLQMRPITTISARLPEIPDRKWNFYVYRDFCVLAHSVQARAAESSLQEKTFGFSIPVYEGLLVNGREFYSEENDSLTLKKWAYCDKDNFFEEFIAAIEKLVGRTKHYATSLKNKCFHGYGEEALFDAYRKAMEVYIESYLPLMMRPDDYLVSKYQSLAGELSAEMLDILTPIWRKTLYALENEDLLRAKISGDIDAYLEKYEWINNPLGKRPAYLIREDVEKRLERLTVCQAEQKLSELNYNRELKKLRFDKLIQGTDSKKLQRLMRLISEFIYLRTYTAENSDRLFYYLREKLIFEIADRMKIPHEEILCMSYREISALGKGEKIDRRTIAKRRSGELITFSDDEIYAYYGSGVSSILKKLLPQAEREGALYGDVACAGEVRGCVKIVRNFDDVDKVEEGDIVVTSMTTPEIVAALEKAGGIITDEGGITCHAAIIAREYGIACLVGTRCATGVLHDGMKVFLDCLNGKVEIISDVAHG